MSYTLLPAHPSGAVRDRLAAVRYVFTDFDGTMLAPNASALADNGNRPCLLLAQALVDLLNAGIEVIPCTARNRTMVQEDCRILGLNSYIGEMGGIVMTDLRANAWEYFTGRMPYDPTCGLTPHQVVERTGVVERILARWPGLIEYHNDMSTGFKYREVTYGLRGEIPGDEAQAILDEAGLGLIWANNGHLTRISRPTSLKLTPGVPGHAYNVTFAGLDKGTGIERFCALRGIDRAQTLAIGDSASDFRVAPYVGTFVCMENGLGDPEASRLVEHGDNVFVSQGAITEGWANMAAALLAARTGR